MVYTQTIDKGKTCPKCKTDYRYIDSGKCVSCHKKTIQANTNMKEVNRRRALAKKLEEKNINDDFYFEDR